jgi:hypothetical protein
LLFNFFHDNFLSNKLESSNYPVLLLRSSFVLKKNQRQIKFYNIEPRVIQYLKTLALASKIKASLTLAKFAEKRPTCTFASATLGLCKQNNSACLESPKVDKAIALQTQFCGLFSGIRH